jgi:hypothetical protein
MGSPVNTKKLVGGLIVFATRRPTAEDRALLKRRAKIDLQEIVSDPG